MLCGATIAHGGGAAAEPSSIKPLSVKLPLTDIVRAGDNLVAIGSRGVILRSSDGLQWEQAPTPVNRMLTSVHFVNSSSGWAVGHDESILHTRDAGQSWILQHFKSSDAPLLDVFFVDEYRGLAVGAFGKLLYTENGGENWSDGASAGFNPMGAHLNGLAQLGDGRLMLVGEMGLIGLSADGRDWSSVDVPYSGSLFDVEPIGERGAIVVGMRGNAFWTADIESQEWKKIETHSVDSLFSVRKGHQSGQFLLAGANNRVFKVTIDLPAQAHGLEAVSSETDSVLVYSGLSAEGGVVVLASDNGPVLLQ